MASHVTMPPAGGTPIRSKLEALVRSFDRDSAVNGKQIRELLRDSPKTFYTATVDLLKVLEDSRGLQYLVSVLVGHDLVLRALCDPALSLDQALRLARAAIQSGAMLDIAVAKHLAENLAPPGMSVCPPEALRLMEILAEISDGTRILPALMTLARHPNAHLQSKAVLMIGRANRSVKWVHNRLRESDPRVRANAVEALWGVETEDARELLHGAAGDSNNRVAGNALIALYRMGDCSVLPELMKMAAHQSRRFRSTAAWVMGETGDPRFVKVLAHMLGEMDGTVRARAFAALGRLKLAAAQSREACEWKVVGKLQPGVAPKGARKLQLQIVSADGREQSVLPTQVMLSEDGEPVIEYKVEERASADQLSVVFVAPWTQEVEKEAWYRAATSCLAWKRAIDCWGCVPYRPITPPDEDPNPPIDDRLHLGGGAKALTDSFAGYRKREACPDLWHALRRGVHWDAGGARGRRHIILINNSEPGKLPDDWEFLLSYVKTARAPLHVVSTVPHSPLEELARNAQGSFQAVQSEEEIHTAIELVCLNLVSRYTVTYQPVGGASRQLCITVSGAGRGATTLEVGGRR